MNDYENTAYQNLWEIAKAVLSGEFIVLKYMYEKRGKAENQQCEILFQEMWGRNLLQTNTKKA